MSDPSTNKGITQAKLAEYERYPDAQKAVEVSIAKAHAKARETADKARSKIDSELAAETAKVDAEIDKKLDEAETRISALRADAMKNE